MDEKRDLRQEVLAFAIKMEEKLRLNDYKGGWKECDSIWLFCRIQNEVGELWEAMMQNRNDVSGEAADVANFCMMLADVWTEVQKDV